LKLKKFVVIIDKIRNYKQIIMNKYKEITITKHELGILPDESSDRIEFLLNKFIDKNKFKCNYHIVLGAKGILHYNDAITFCIHKGTNEIVHVSK